MKILKNTPDRFELRFVPWILGIAFSAVILVTSGAGLRSLLSGEWKDAFVLFLIGPVFVGLAFALMVRRDDLILDRTTGTIEIRHRTVFGRKTEYFDLARLEQASTQTHYANDSNRQHRVALILSGDHPKDVINVTPVYSGGPDAKRAADAINAWHKQG